MTLWSRTPKHSGPRSSTGAPARWQRAKWMFGQRRKCSATSAHGSMRVVRHPEVPQELEAAACWYQDRLAGLGEDFLLEYQATMTRILQEPTRWRKIRGENRKLNFRRFPYAIVYSVRDGVLYVTAV